MSATIASYLILGIRVSKTDFFDNVGTERCCSKCGKVRKRTAFCPSCGGEVKDQTAWKAKPAFVAYAKDEEDAKPELAWHALYENQGCYEGEEVCLRDINASQPVWDRKDERIALGLLVSQIREYSVPDVKPIDLDLPYAKVQEFAEKLGIPAGREIELFHCLYYS